MNERARSFLNDLEYLISQAEAWGMIETRGSEAHDYCRWNGIASIGENVWHAILDDAIRMRKVIANVTRKDQ